MQRKLLAYSVLLVFMIAAVIAVGFVRTGVGQAGGGINANSCNADPTCEVNEILSTTGPIRMTAANQYIHSDGWIGAKKFVLVGDPGSYPSDDGAILAAGDIRSKKAVYGERFVRADDYLSAGNYLIVGSGNANPGQGGVAAAGKVQAKEVVATGGPIRMTDPGWYVHSDGWIGAKSFLQTDGFIKMQDCVITVDKPTETLKVDCSPYTQTTQQLLVANPQTR